VWCKASASVRRSQSTQWSGGRDARIRVLVELHMQIGGHKTRPDDRARQEGTGKMSGPHTQGTLESIQQCELTPPQDRTRGDECPRISAWERTITADVPLPERLWADAGGRPKTAPCRRGQENPGPTRYRRSLTPGCLGGPGTGAPPQSRERREQERCCADLEEEGVDDP